MSTVPEWIEPTPFSPAHSSSALSSSRPNLHSSAYACQPCHICTGTGLTPATSAPGLGSPLPHLHWDWAHPCHICTWTGLTPATSAPGPSTRRVRRECCFRVLSDLRGIVGALHSMQHTKYNMRHAAYNTPQRHTAYTMQRTHDSMFHVPCSMRATRRNTLNTPNAPRHRCTAHPRSKKSTSIPSRRMPSRVTISSAARIGAPPTAAADAAQNVRPAARTRRAAERSVKSCRRVGAVRYLPVESPGPGADVGGASPVPVQMRQG